MGIGIATLGFIIAYGSIIILGLFLGWKVFTSKNILNKCLFAIGGLVCFLFIGLTLFTGKRDLKLEGQQFVGTYQLTKYPNCDSCEAILKGDNSFLVISTKTQDEGKVLEKGNWHYVAEGDFLGVYMDKEEKELLGSYRFEYSYYINPQNKVIEAPKMGPL